ncbi:MAG TPA: methylated-DNA--[protein]-cysteine S-methyltransferase [Phycisphaerae bacterium]|nr:methylated-DNA--[protein]-cysteine S-methyltransferase [Phycisphaerae bacterium]
MIVARQRGRGRKIARSLNNGPVVIKSATSTYPSPYIQHDMAFIPTAWGLCALVWKQDETAPDALSSGFIETPENALLCRILTPGLPPHDLRQLILKQHPDCREVMGDREGNFHPEVVPAWFPELARFLRAYYTNAVCGGVGCDFSNTWNMWKQRLDWSTLSPFQQAVLNVTATIPRGQRLTYGEVARKIGKPRASRAVGAALGANPWPVLIPCHRVIGANGSMTGFSAPGGIEVKRRMLEMEQSSRLF